MRRTFFALWRRMARVDGGRLESHLSYPILFCRTEFDGAVDRLTRVGYKCRAKYARTLNRMAQRTAIIPAQRIGDRSYLPHRSGRAGRRRR